MNMRKECLLSIHRHFIIIIISSRSIIQPVYHTNNTCRQRWRYATTSWHETDDFSPTTYVDDVHRTLQIAATSCWKLGCTRWTFLRITVIRLICRFVVHTIRCSYHTAAIRDSLLPVQQRIEYKICVLVYKWLHQAAPIYLSELCIPVATFAGRSHLRSAVKECLVIGYCRTKNYGQRSFSYSGPTLWNSLPQTVRDPSMSLLQFCARLKTEMFCRAYDWS